MIEFRLLDSIILLNFVKKITKETLQNIDKSSIYSGIRSNYSWILKDDSKELNNSLFIRSTSMVTICSNNTWMVFIINSKINHHKFEVFY